MVLYTSEAKRRRLQERTNYKPRVQSKPLVGYMAMGDHVQGAIELIMRYDMEEGKSRNPVKGIASDITLFRRKLHGFRLRSCSFFVWARGVFGLMQEGGTVMRGRTLGTVGAGGLVNSCGRV